MSLSVDLRHDLPPLDFSAELPEGEIVALVGPSGSGKTSLLRAVAGLLRVRHARIELAGQVWDGPGIHRATPDRPIGFVPQHYGLFPHLSALGNVETSLLAWPPGPRRQRALALLETARVADCAERLPRALSGGQRQRVALARALAREPKLLLLDEPFAAVDRVTRKALYVELKQLHRQRPMTILLVTHDLDEAAQLASHLLLIDRGRIVQSGPVTEVLTRPRSETAARLLDIPNLFAGEIEAATAGKPRLRWGPHRLLIGRRDWPAGECRFAVLPHNVLLIRPDKPWGSHLENPVDGTVVDRLELGPEILLWVEPAGLPGCAVQMRVPARVLDRYHIAVGSPVQLGLRAADLILLER